MPALDVELVATRLARLNSARQQLKQTFVGIDTIVDELCDAIQVWFVAPQLLSRPVIVNLWGMTGVGKTDLIRRLVAALDLSERFIEIELTNADSTTWHTSVASRLSDSGALSGEPTLLLFDEIQRFNTLDHEQKPVVNTKFSDFWELLSDGRLARRESPELAYLTSTLSRQAAAVSRKKEQNEPVPPEEERLGYWEANNLKRTLSLSTPVEELERLTPTEAVRMLSSARSNKTVFQPLDLSRCLVVISGNLDEAFQMSGQGSEADMDADVFAAHTANITVVDIKNALMRRFKPEQVARFGNLHLIYSSLKRVDFETLIAREVDRVRRNAKEQFEVDVSIDSSVNDLIYRNGVFPVQGVRPVFSSVADILESNLAKVLFTALMNGTKSASLRYDLTNRRLIACVGKDETVLPYTGRIDKIRIGSSPEKVANIAVHEAGHALMYALLFKLAPRQLTARVASSYVGGFTAPHTMYETAESMVSDIKVSLAGGLTEELIFGPKYASVGRGADRERATRQVIDYVRRYGFDEEFQAQYMLDAPYQLGTVIADSDIEKMTARLVAETRRDLAAHHDALVSLARELARRGSMRDTEVSETLEAHGVNVGQRPEEHLLIADYAHVLDSAKKVV